MTTARSAALCLAILCACQHGRAFTIAPAPSGATVPAGWIERRPAHAEDAEVDRYFVRPADGAWMAVFSFSSKNAHDLPITEAFTRTVNQLGYRVLRFADQPLSKRPFLRTTELPRPLEGTAGDGAEIAMSLDEPPLRAYAAIVRQPGRRYAFVIAGASGEAPLPADEARDIARRIRFEPR